MLSTDRNVPNPEGSHRFVILTYADSVRRPLMPTRLKGRHGVGKSGRTLTMDMIAVGSGK